jgi:predicted phosphoribosyltransferase
MEMMRLRDRAHAGRLLAEELSDYAQRDDVIVLGLPCGGVPVAYEVAGVLQAPLDVFVVHKLGLPGREELALGAIASGGTRVLNAQLVEALRMPPAWIDTLTATEAHELTRRDAAYRGDRPPPDLRDRTVIPVDDGLATGSTMRAAIWTIRQSTPARIVVAVPVADPDVCAALREEADEVHCLFTPRNLRAVGGWYEDFSPTTDDDVCELLERAWGPAAERKPK